MNKFEGMSQLEQIFTMLSDEFRKVRGDLPEGMEKEGAWDFRFRASDLAIPYKVKTLGKIRAQTEHGVRTVYFYRDGMGEVLTFSKLNPKEDTKKTFKSRQTSA